jgi:hypothetical protein
MKRWDIADACMWIAIAMMYACYVHENTLQDAYTACLAAQKDNPKLECKQP